MSILNIKIKGIIFFAIIIAFASACSTTKNLDKKENVYQKTQVRTMEIRASVSPKFPDFDQSFSAQMRLAGYDSVSLNALGPFGIALGKLYADDDKFIFYNAFENTVFRGKPNSENLYKAARINLSYRDLVAFIRSEMPGNLSLYEIYEDNDEQTTYIHKLGSEGAEFFVVSKSYKAVTHYQRKDKANQLELNVKLSNFEAIEGNYFAKKIQFEFPKLDGSLDINIEEIEINKPFGKEFKFSVPKSAKVISFD